MKLRNKKTGEIGDLLPYGCEDGKIWVWIDNMSRPEYRYNSLAELNEDWEDYEEPKRYWFMDYGGRIKAMNDSNDEEDVARKQIGNYFKTKEEAEKAVEKLKAWKRLKDIGCSFDGWNVKTSGSEGDHLLINLHIKDFTGCDELLDLLFGGEE